MSTPNPLALPEPEDFLANQAFLRRLALSLVHDENRADDLVQETWTAWAEHRPGRLAAPRAWLARVLRNRALNARRSEERRGRREALVARIEPVDPSADAEATLAVQAGVVEALRKLDEPYRSTLLQRYFHDLPPQAIAERTGTPLNTVKARLARGLERMRAELDRRYGNDRGAWCHWLLVLGGPSAAIAPALSPATSTGKAGPGVAGPAAAASGAPSFVLGVLVWLAIVSAIAVAVWWPRREVDFSTAQATELAEPARPVELAYPDRVELEVDRVPVESAPVVPDENPLPAAPARIAFDWPQFAGGFSHDNLRKREDRIRHPRVLWHVKGCAGQPTLEGGDLYSGGAGLFRIDPMSGEVLARVLGPERPRGEASPLRELAALGELGEEEPGSPREPGLSPTVAAAPAITRELVLARRSTDGGLSAFDRALQREVWSWKPEEPGPCSWPGCLRDYSSAGHELFIVPHRSEVIALRVADGSVAWRFSTEGAGDVQMIPACRMDRVFFGAEGGAFFALRLANGEEIWRVDTGGWLGRTHPVSLGGQVVFADRGSAATRPGQRPEPGVVGRKGELRSLSFLDGRELWKTGFGATGFSTPGVGHGLRGWFLVGGYGTVVARFDFTTGMPDERHVVRTGRNAFGSPTVVGDSLVFGNLDGNLYVHDLETGVLLWAFRLPEGAQVGDFVHTGERIFASTTLGLFCLGDDREKLPAPSGFVLEWKEDERKGDEERVPGRR